jgi:hypothetical protein
MDATAARQVLGVAPSAPWAEVRAAYRSAIRAAHPDRAGGSTARAAHLNEAYATLVRDRRDGPAGGRRGWRADRAPGPPPPPPATRPEPVGPVEVLDGDTLRLPVPPDEAFVAILDACHRIGSVTYVDRSCAILEALVPIAGEGTCSLVVTFQGRAHGTDAFCTLEAIEHVASPPVRPVVAALAAALGP